MIWGAASPIFKLALQNIPPFTLAFIRFFEGAAILFPFAVNQLRIEKKDWFTLVLLSFFGITVNISFFFLGLKQAPSVNAPIIASSGPVFLYLFSILILGEKPQKKILKGILISIVGVLLIVGEPLVEQGFNGELIGNLLFVIATLGSVGHAIFSKKIMTNYRPVVITFWSFCIGALSFLPFLPFEFSTVNPLATLDYRGWIGIVFGVLFSSALGYFLYEWGLSRIKAQEVGLFTYIDPVIAMAIAVPLLGESFSPIFIIGSLFIFLGIFLAEGRLHYHPLSLLKRLVSK